MVSISAPCTKAAATGGARAHRIPMRWLRRPELAEGDRICVLVMLPVHGTLLPHSLDHAAAWKSAGYKVVAVAAVASLDDPVDMITPEQADGYAIRLNRGYDFGGWAAAIHALTPSLSSAHIVALANDSVLGPSDAFPAMLERVDQASADVLGLVENHEVRHHLQSFTLFFKAAALRAPVFAAFWRRVRSGGRAFVIDHYETRLMAIFQAAGLRAQALFALPSDGNPTLVGWRELLGLGFPYIKVQLLRDNPREIPLADWRAAAADSGFDVVRLDRQIAALKQHGTARWQV